MDSHITVICCSDPYDLGKFAQMFLFLKVLIIFFCVESHFELVPHRFCLSGIKWPLCAINSTINFGKTFCDLFYCFGY